MKIKVKDIGWISYHKLDKDSVYEVEKIVPFDEGDYSSFEVVFCHPDHIGRTFKSILWDECVEIVEGSIDEYK